MLVSEKQCKLETNFALIVAINFYVFNIACVEAYLLLN